MTHRKLLSEVASCIRGYGFSPTVAVDREIGLIEVSLHTTKTRASTIQSRLGLIVAELADGHEFSTTKECVGELPKRREALAQWTISVALPPASRTRSR
jgi:hypothetical protein